jgi:ADP-ribose pyrophosphatase YjhB (NUDIX family)
MIHEIKCQRCGETVETYRNPFPTVDLAVIRDGSILLIKRKNPPEGWALPGGFIDYGEPAELAAARELREETGLRAGRLELLGVYSEPQRDPRFHTLSVVYLAAAEGIPQAGDDASRAEWFAQANLPDQIAFDHRRIIKDAFLRNRTGN